MERKIGEIFEFGGEWYQCIEGRCIDCYFSEKRFLCKQFLTKNFCTSGIIYKKLEKVGDSYSKYVFPRGNVLVQRYKLHIPCDTNVSNGYWIHHWNEKLVDIEIKQNKEDMEENKLNLKPFNLEEAKAGKPVCTRDGRKARIICFDRNSNKPIVALITTNDREYLTEYYCDGRISHNSSESNDLMILPEKKEGWVNVYKRKNEYICENEYSVSTGIAVYKSESEAKRNINKNEIYVNTIKITWEE